MSEFSLIFRNDPSSYKSLSPKQMEESMKNWENWFGSIAGQNLIVENGNQLGPAGATLKPNNVVTDGPYTEIKEMITGYSVIRAANLDEAIHIAKGCPALNEGGSVEVRSIISMV